MPTYRIHRMKDNARQQFRWQPHTTGATTLKPRDFEEGGMMVDAPSAYGVWMTLRETPDALDVGDVLETGSGELLVCKYVGFEEARWFVPEPKVTMPVEATIPAGAAEATQTS